MVSLATGLVLRAGSEQATLQRVTSLHEHGKQGARELGHGHPLCPDRYAQPGDELAVLAAYRHSNGSNAQFEFPIGTRPAVAAAPINFLKHCGKFVDRLWRQRPAQGEKGAARGIRHE